MGRESNRVYDSHNMNIDYSGDQLSEEQLESAVRVLNRLLQWCPCTSYLTANFAEEADHIHMAISVQSQGKAFISEKSGDDFDHALAEATKEIQAQIKEWRQKRFFEKPGRVLIVDDDPDAVQVLERCFQSLGWQTHSMSSGTEIIRELPRIPTDYNLLVIDIVMPILDGMGTLSAVENLVDKNAYPSWKGVRLPYLTYSAKPERDLLPLMDSKCFYYLGHLQKGGTLADLEKKTKEMLSSLDALPSSQPQSTEFMVASNEF